MTENQSLPLAFQHTEQTTLNLGNGKKAQIPVVQTRFFPWRGEIPKDTYGKKQILNYKGDKFFAELLILELFKEIGWGGAWVDTFHHRLLKSYWPKEEAEISGDKLAILEKIYKEKGNRAGCFDVICWKEDTAIFVESKRKNRDHIRESQKDWINAALKSGLNESDLLIIEWTLAD